MKRDPTLDSSFSFDSSTQGAGQGAVVARLLVAVLVVQLIWWLGVAPQFSQSALPAGTFITKAAIAPIEYPSLGKTAQADWQDVQLTWSECCTSAYYAVRFTLPDGAAADLGLIAGVGADNYAVYVNGVAVHSPGELAPSSYHGLRKGIVRVPVGLLQPSHNEALLLTARNSQYYTDVFPAFVADYRTLEEATRWRQFVVEDLRLINVQIPLIVAITCLLLLSQARNRWFLAALAALALVWGLRNGFYTWETFPFGEYARRCYYVGITTALPLAWFAFAHFWADSARSAPRWSLALVASAFAWLLGNAWAIWRLTAGDVVAIEASERFVELFGVAVTALAALRMVAHLLHGLDERVWEAALLVLCMSTFAVEMAQYFFMDFGTKTSLNSAAIFLLAFVVAIVARNVQLFESMAAFNRSLNQRLLAKESEIRATYEQLEAASREATLARERQRLLQDVHDGIGSQLFSLLALVRGRQASSETIETALEESLDDLRLIIDSLDTATDRLAVALGAFRARVEPRLKASGLETQWNLDGVPFELRCSPDQVLQVYRILQEAVSNVLKHSAAKRLTLRASASATDDGFSVQLSVEDDGQWRDQAAGVASRGLESMRNRARALAGALSVDSDATGTTVAVEFPVALDSGGAH